MRTSHVSLPAFLALACALCALPARAQLTPENKANNPYVPQAGDLAAQGWGVLNAADEETQDTDLSGYTFTADGTESYLDFSGDANPLGGLETVYLALGIADTDGSPIEMTRDDTNAFRTDNVYAKVRFERSADAPSMDDLRTMYPSYPHGNTTVAPKLGLYVDADGYFCVSRIRAGETATQEDTVFEFCTTKVHYTEVSSSEGAVVVRVEFQTFAATTTAPSVRGFRIWVRDAATDDTEKGICLTAGLGYRWTQKDETKGYTFDFSSLEQGDGCDWFYAIDSAQMGFDMNMNASALEALNQLAFSATGGGFYSAWLDINGSALTRKTLKNYDFGEFNAFLQGNPMDNLVTDWASRYGVDLMQYGTAKTRRFMAADGADRTHGFNAFLLDMDPKAQVEQRLQVTGIVPAADGSVTLTVRGPEGCVLKNALRRAGILHVTRAETLEGLATAASEPISVGELAFDGNAATLTLGGDGAPKPFMKVTLQPNPPAAE